MLRLSPSLIALYFYYECPRFLIYRASAEITKKIFGSSDFINKHSPVTRAILGSGYIWEERVVEKLLKGRVVMAKPERGKKTRDRIFESDDTLKELSRLRDGNYLYQGTLPPSTSFQERFRLDPARVAISHSRPDLIGCSGKGTETKFSVVDVKASPRMKTTHKIQVAVYSLLLHHIVKDSGIAGGIDLEEGRVWLYGEEEPFTFQMRNIMPHISRFLEDEVHIFCGMAPEALPWHLNYRCEGCEFYGYCKERANAAKSVSLLPYLSVPAKKYLSSGSTGVQSLNDFSALLRRRDAAEVLSRSASLNGKKEQLQAQLKALNNEEVLTYGDSSLRMPVYEDVRVIISAERDPFTGSIYALAWNRFGGKAIYGDTSEEQIFIAGKPAQCGSIQEQFVTSLYKCLIPVHNHNAETEEWGERLSVQFYIYDGYEAEILNEVLAAQLKNKRAAAAALDLLFTLQSETLTHTHDHPEAAQENLLVAIADVVRELFALPVAVAYTLKTAFDSLKPAGFKFNFSGHEKFNFELGNAMKTEPLYYAWFEDKSENIASIEKEVHFRFIAKSAIIQGIREKAFTENGRRLLFRYPPKFTFPDSAGVRNELYSKLIYMTKYEKLLEYLETRSSRTLNRRYREENGILFVLTALEDDSCTFRVRCSDFTDDLESVFGWILTEDNDEGDLGQMAYKDYLYKDNAWNCSRFSGYYIPKAAITGFRGKDVLLHLELRKGKESPRIAKGRKYLLQRSFKDFISKRIIGRLHHLDEGANYLPYQVLRKPEKFLKKIQNAEKAISVLKKTSGSLGLTPSQQKSLEHFFLYNLSLLWGPPGTGKTHFIAIAVLSLLEYSRRNSMSCRIFITAYTHAAIETCLAKIMELNEKHGFGEKEPLCLRKLREIKLEKYAHIEYFESSCLMGHLDSSVRSVTGGTIFELGKLLEKGNVPEFDVVVIDEASQMKVPDAVIPLSVLAPGGRFLIAGDDKQLPPILKGAYPDPIEGGYRIDLSVFEMIRANDAREKTLCRLLENFRMNATLSMYPASAIYGPDYKSFNDVIARRRITLSAYVEDQGMIEYILNPDYPLTVCVLDGVLASRENPEEAAIVGKLARQLRKTLCIRGSGHTYPAGSAGDKSFWKDGLVIISPHHAQINHIAEELEKNNLRDHYYVDTVDKMQGQECDVVIVSYGVSDVETAAIEGEFIYSLNRLNVSITRARSKCIVFLSRPLLNPTLEILDDEKSADGIEFMLGLEQYAKTGETKEFSLSKKDNICLVVHRVKA